MTRAREPPIARLIPISRVRSATDMAIVLITDRPPTIRLIRATPTMIALKIATDEPTTSSNSVAVIADAFGMSASIRAARASTSVPSSG